MLLGPLALLLVATVGSVLAPAIGAVIAGLASDPTYTGRTEIWAFALDNIAKRPVTGFGYGAFWESVFYGGGGDATTWVNRATDSHNGYLNTALETGLPALALTVWWLVLVPLRDLEAHLGSRQGRRSTRSACSSCGSGCSSSSWRCSNRCSTRPPTRCSSSLRWRSSACASPPGRG